MYVLCDSNDNIINFFNKISDISDIDFKDQTHKDDNHIRIYDIHPGLNMKELKELKNLVFSGTKEQFNTFKNEIMLSEYEENIKFLLGLYVSKMEHTIELEFSDNKYKIDNYNPGRYDIIDFDVLNSEYDLSPDSQYLSYYFDFDIQRKFNEHGIIECTCTNIRYKKKLNCTINEHKPTTFNLVPV
jgi:hypothetical protein